MSLYVKIKKNLGNFMLDVEFSMENGVLGLLGASGAGKSMVLKCIAGIERPDEGRIVLDDTVLFDSGEKINIPPQKRQIGFLFQQYALFPNMTVLKNVMCGAGKKEDALHWIEKFHLEHRRNHYPSQLSGGEQQRVAMARMLATNPKLILFDEPFSALDQYLKASVEQEIMNVLDEVNCNAVFVSHDRGEVYRMTNQIVVLEHGHVADNKEKHELFKNPQTMAATLITGCKNISEVVCQEDGSYRATDWGLRLLSPGCRNYQYAGIRAHHLSLMTQQKADVLPDSMMDCDKHWMNMLELSVVREIEDTFSYILLLKTEGSKLLTYELSKEEWIATKNTMKNEKIYVKLPPDAIIWMER